MAGGADLSTLAVDGQFLEPIPLLSRAADSGVLLRNRYDCESRVMRLETLEIGKIQYNSDMHFGAWLGCAVGLMRLAIPSAVSR